MTAILIITLIIGVSGALANTAWVILGGIKDKRKGDISATIERNLKASGINLVIFAVMMFVAAIARDFI